MYSRALWFVLPFAAWACCIDSIVWAMTPSSAAITNTTISVEAAPLALIELNAAWPGVSKNVIDWPLGKVTESYSQIRVIQYIKNS